MSLLAFIKSKKVFLKIQEGTGDGGNLMREDINDGYVDYVLWSTFRPECLDIDQTLDMYNDDSGMVLSKEPITALMSLESCYKDAFYKEPYDADDVEILMTDEDLPE